MPPKDKALSRRLCLEDLFTFERFLSLYWQRFVDDLYATMQNCDQPNALLTSIELDDDSPPLRRLTHALHEIEQQLEQLRQSSDETLNNVTTQAKSVLKVTLSQLPKRHESGLASLTQLTPFADPFLELAYQLRDTLEALLQTDSTGLALSVLRHEHQAELDEQSFLFPMMLETINRLLTQNQSLDEIQDPKTATLPESPARLSMLMVEGAGDLEAEIQQAIEVTQKVNQQCTDEAVISTVLRRLLDVAQLEAFLELRRTLLITVDQTTPHEFLITLLQTFIEQQARASIQQVCARLEASEAPTREYTQLKTLLYNLTNLLAETDLNANQRRYHCYLFSSMKFYDAALFAWSAYHYLAFERGILFPNIDGLNHFIDNHYQAAKASSPLPSHSTRQQDAVELITNSPTPKTARPVQRVRSAKPRQLSFLWRNPNQEPDADGGEASNPQSQFS